jgi:hypothetical protein
MLIVCLSGRGRTPQLKVHCSRETSFLTYSNKVVSFRAKQTNTLAHNYPILGLVAIFHQNQVFREIHFPRYLADNTQAKTHEANHQEIPR